MNGAPQQLTADKREIKDFPKLPFVNFFYPQTVIRNAIPLIKYIFV